LRGRFLGAQLSRAIRPPCDSREAVRLSYAPNVAKKQSTTAFQGRRFSCETPIRVLSPEFTLHAIWRKNVGSGFTPQPTALEGRRTGEICNGDDDSRASQPIAASIAKTTIERRLATGVELF